MTDTSGDAQTLPGSGGRAPSLARGQIVGRYLVLEALGSGAMGVVYAAWDPSLDRKVALKLVRGAGDGQLEARLLREARALARLTHPNVVAVHDVGTHEGQVFLAMEHIEGTTLGQWLEQPRTWHETLARFLEAGRGLAAAHGAQLVHRDFKPDNVLVANSGRVCVTDFGLARAVDVPSPRETSPASPSHLATTVEGAVTGTPAYMSPEQFRGLPADARSDQFSFCVALYEALWRQRPFQGENFGELEAAVLQGRLAPPPRGVVPARVRDAVLRGLSTSPEARFPTMAQLLDELAPRRLITPARAAVAVALVAGLVAVVGARRPALCTGAEAQKARVWNADRRGRIEAAFASTGALGAPTAAARALETLDAYASAWADMHTEACRATRITGEQSELVLERRMQCLGRRLDELDAQAALFEKPTPDLVARAVQAAKSLSRLAPCAELATVANGELLAAPANSQRVVAVRRQLADVKALRNSGRYAQAAERAEAVIPDAASSGEQAVEAEAWFRVGDAQELSGKPELAERALERAFFLAVGARHDTLVAESATALVLVTGARRAHYEAAAQWERHALAALQRIGGNAEVEGNLEDAVATGLKGQGKVAEAVVRQQRALELRERTFGPEHPVTAASLNNLANSYGLLHRLDEAEANYVKAREVYERALGPEHPRVAMAWDNLASVYEARGDGEHLAESAERGLALREKLLPPTHPELALSLLHVAVSRSWRRDHAAALSGITRALEILSASPGPTHPLTLETAVYAGELALAAGDADDARSRLQKVLETTTNGGLRFRCSVGLAEVAAAKGQPALAEQLLTTARPDAGSEPTFEQARAGVLRARLRLAAGDRPAALAHLVEARSACVAAGHRGALLAEIDSLLAQADAGSSAVHR